MKTFLKNIVCALLSLKARKVLASGAKIIAVTGSMGKTTAKEAIAHVLEKKYALLKAEEGFNTEIGILLTLLGEKKSGYSSLWKWLQIFWRAFWREIPNPDIILLEFGVDRPNDMNRLLRLVQPHYVVLTMVAPVHLGAGHFANIEEIAAEKAKLPQSLNQGELAILNGDNEHIQNIYPSVPANILSYGTQEKNDYRVMELSQQQQGISFVVENKNKRQNYSIPLIGTYHWSVLLPAIILGRQFGISCAESAESLETFSPPAGRGRILEGRNGSTLWDSSYNSSPTATTAALRTLSEIPAKRHLALLGTMNELGEYSAKFHQELGEVAAEHADEIFFVGKEAEAFAEGVKAQKPVRFFETAEAAGGYLRGYLQAGDMVLIKGSQNGVFLEKAVGKMLLRISDERFLCRQRDNALEDRTDSN